MAQQIVERLLGAFAGRILAHGTHLGNDWAVVHKDALVEVATFLRDEKDLAMDMPIDCTVVDYLGVKKPRFEVVYHLYSTTQRHRLRLKVPLGDASPEVGSLTAIWAGMNWHEREAWDLYGVRFVGHPDLRRILTYDGFEGHPLRPMREVRTVPTQRHAPQETLNRP